MEGSAYLGCAEPLAKLSETLAKAIKVSTNSTHKEETKNARNIHRLHVKNLVAKLKDYGNDPFLGKAREISTGRESDTKVVEDMISAEEMGNGFFQCFVEESLLKNQTNLTLQIKQRPKETNSDSKGRLQIKKRSSGIWHTAWK